MPEDTFSSPEDKRKKMAVNSENKFSSTFSTYLTLLGYSLGMSDIWRFPFLLKRNGGGIVYFL
jgi:SNF family Na+-dependent transporter